MTIFHFTDILDFIAERGVSPAKEEDLFEFIRQVLVGLSEEKDFQAYSAGKSRRIWRGVVPERAFIYVPFACFVGERVVGTNAVVGFRTSALDANPDFVKSWASLKKLYQSHRGADNSFAKLWDKCAEFMKVEFDKLA